MIHVSSHNPIILLQCVEMLVVGSFGGINQSEQAMTTSPNVTTSDGSLGEAFPQCVLVQAVGFQMISAYFSVNPRIRWEISRVFSKRLLPTLTSLQYPRLISSHLPPTRSQVTIWPGHLILRIHLRGVVISDYSYEPSHYSCIRTLGEWLASQGIPGIYGVDTRQRNLGGKG